MMASFGAVAAAGALLAGAGLAQTAGAGGTGGWRRDAFVPTAAPAQLGEFEDTTVSPFGYATKWKRLGWAAYPELQARFPAAHLGARLQEKAFVVIVPLYLGDLRAEMDAICGGFRTLLPVSDALMENQQPGVEVRELDVNGRPARDMRWFRVFPDSVVPSRNIVSLHRARVVLNGGAAIMIAGWMVTNSGVEESALEYAIDSVQLSRPSSEAANAELSVAQSQSRATLLNAIGLHYYQIEDYTKCVPYFAAAWRQMPMVASLLGNFVDVCERTGLQIVALETLQKNEVLWRGNDVVGAYHARLLASSGDGAQALKEYASLCGAPDFANEGVLIEYVELLARSSRLDDALKTISWFTQRHPSKKLLRWQASLLIEHQRKAEAVALLEGLLARDGDPDVAADLASACNVNDQPEKAEAILQKLIKDGRDTSRIRLSLGYSHMRRKLYGKAKEQFELALKRDPQNAEAKSAIETASAALGQGDNSRIKEPIAPVDIPEPLLALVAEAKPPEAGKVKGYGAYYEHYITGFRFHPGQPLVQTRRLKLRVLDKGGVTRFSTLQFEFDPVRESIFVNKLIVLDAAGKIVGEGKPDQYYIADDTTSGLATQDKHLKTPVPGLQPGFTIEAEVTWRDLFPEKELTFRREWFLLGSPCSHRSFFIVGAVDQVKPVASPGLKAIQGDGVIYWHEADASAFTPEPFMPRLETFVPHVLVGHRGLTWERVAKDHLEAIKDRLEYEPALWTLQSTLTTGLRSPEEKLRAIVRFMQENIHYEGIEFGRRAQVPHPGSVTLANKYGDCKDHSVLLVQLLRMAGVEAHLALVNTVNDVCEELPSLDQFNHVVVHVPSNPSPFIDATLKFIPVESLTPESVAGTLALVLDEKKPRLVRVPEVKAGSSVIESSRVVTLRDPGETAVEETLRLEGYAAGWYRAWFDQSDPAQHLQRMQGILRGPENARLLEFEFENLKDISQPARLRLSYILPRSLQKEGGVLEARFPSVMLGEYLRASFVKDRKSPFELRDPVVMRSEILLESGVALAGGGPAASPARGSSKFAEWQITAARKHGQEQILFEFAPKMGAFPPEEYAAFQNDRVHAFEALTARRKLAPLKTAPPKPAKTAAAGR